MATVTTPIATDATLQNIDTKLGTLLTKMDALAAAFQPNAAGIDYSNITSGLTADDVQEAIDENAGAITEIKSSLSLQKIAENIALTTTVDTKTITSINGALEVWLLGKVNSTFRGSLALPASVFKAGYACYIPCIGGNVSATIYVEYVSDTQIKCSTTNATFNYLDIYVKKQ